MATTFVPRTNQPRPQLPNNDYNKRLHGDSATMQPVKFQVITREGQEIVVGRIKVPTPNGHAFILRRFDTGAISLSTMFRACYPTASEEAEKAETSWVKANFDTAGSNGGGRLRLAGTWIPPALGLHLAERYSLLHILPALVEAAPESKAAYRKSAKTTSSPSATAVANETSHAAVQATVNGTPVPALGIPTSLPPTTPRSPRLSTRSAATAASPVRQPPPKRPRKSVSPAPSLIPKPSPSKAVRSSPRRSAKVQEEEEEPEVPGPDPDQDIAEAKADVARLKAEREAALSSDMVLTTPAAKKRGIQATQTPPHKLDLEKIEQSAMEIVPHRPVVNPRRLQNLAPSQKAAAWGGLALIVGFGATAIIPTLLAGGTFGLW